MVVTVMRALEIRTLGRSPAPTTWIGGTVETCLFPAVPEPFQRLLRNVGTPPDSSLQQGSVRVGDPL